MNCEQQSPESKQLENNEAIGSVRGKPGENVACATLNMCFVSTQRDTRQLLSVIV